MSGIDDGPVGISQLKVQVRTHRLPRTADLTQVLARHHPRSDRFRGHRTVAQMQIDRGQTIVLLDAYEIGIGRAVDGAVAIEVAIGFGDDHPGCRRHDLH
jgi:hypothetical protein